MRKGLSKQFVLVTAIVASVTVLFFTSLVWAQESECFYDPYPSEAQSVSVSCDDPSCNVGPCTTLQDGGAGTSLPQNEERQVERAERLETQETEREAQHQGLQERVQDRVINLTANVVARLQSAVERFEQIIARIDARIIKLNTLGVETGEAKAALDAAKEKLRIAQGGLENLSSIRNAMSGDKPKEAFATIRTELRTIHSLLKETHTELRTVIALLKEAVASAEPPQGVRSAVTDAEESANVDSSETQE